MGCDIHALYEVKNKQGKWVGVGYADIDRDYTIFSMLANVRNSNNIPYLDSRIFTISYLSETPYEPCSKNYEKLCESWAGDGHSHGGATLEDLKKLDVKNIKIDEYAQQRWKEIINSIERLRRQHHVLPCDIRIVFLFDN